MTAPCNVAAALTEQARRQPEAPAIHYPVGLRDGRIDYAACSYRELDEASDRCARGLLAFGIARGGRAALMVPPGREFFVLFFALFKAGIAPVLIDPGIGLKSLRQCLGEAEPEAFIGISRAQAASILLRWSPSSIKRRVTVGRRWFWGGATLAGIEARGRDASDPSLADTGPDDLAAILFTSGSTGVPKGVVYRHRHFARQVEMLRDAFHIEPGEVDLATFPPFALFDPALGMTTVVPRMDPTRPAKADPALLTQSMERFGVTNLFGSPALLGALSRHAEREGIRFPTLRRAISAGAAVPAATVRRMRAAMEDGSRVHTPYGATECLPVASISSEELDEELTSASDEGRGTCVGLPVPPNEVAVIPVSDEPLERFDPAAALGPGEIGEIVVHGPTTTEAYWRRERQTRLAKLRDDAGRTWHRMGDVGYRDEEGRLWYCGRKSQRVRLADRDLYPDQLEAVFNRHPDVFRTALVGVGGGPPQRPVLCVELLPDAGADEATVRRDLLATAASRDEWSAVGTILFHPAFPVDIRHNSKIGREALARWAGEQLRKGA